MLLHISYAFEIASVTFFFNFFCIRAYLLRKYGTVTRFSRLAFRRRALNTRVKIRTSS